MIRLIKQYELKKILDEHMLWLQNNNKGKRADLRYAILSHTNLKCVRVNDIKGKTIISIQVDTTRKNNAINYWVDLDIVTTGCFQGTLTELKEQVKITHNDNEFLRNRYERVISFIENEVRINKI